MYDIKSKSKDLKHITKDEKIIAIVEGCDHNGLYQLVHDANKYLLSQPIVSETSHKAQGK